MSAPTSLRVLASTESNARSGKLGSHRVGPRSANCRARGRTLVGGIDMAKRTGSYQDCATCGDRFYVRPSEVRKGRRFCSRQCCVEGQRGEGNPKWRGGTYRATSGYVYALAPDHPHATKGGYVMQHRLVMEAHLGRHLSPDEEVHHINHVRDDNRIANLAVMDDVQQHRREHAGYTIDHCPTCGAEVERSALHRSRYRHKFCSRQCAAAHGSQRNQQRAAERRARRARRS